jgi:hypothetical protein
MLASFDPSSLGGQAAQAGAATQQVEFDREVVFPCTPETLRYRLVKDLTTGKTTVIDRKSVSVEPYNWAVCHAGSWVRHKRHYAWVAGGKRHHVEPVRWVKFGRQVAFVPLHPYDVKDQPALNAKHIVFEVIGKNEIRLEPVKLDSTHHVEFLKEPPREYRNESLRPLARAEEPRMEAHAFAGEPGRMGAAMSRASIPIHFDARSLNFMVARQEARGGKTTTVFAPITNRSGSLQSRAESFSGGSGFRGGGSNGSGSGSPVRDSVGSFHDRGGSSTSTGGSAFHGAGSGAGAGGGGSYHGGGSSSASSSGSSAGSSSAASSSSSSSAASSSGGAHR